MSHEGFFRRWSRLKAHGESPAAAAAEATPQPAAANEYLRAGVVGNGPGAQAPASSDALAGFEPLPQTTQHPPIGPAPGPAATERRQPTVDDVALLGPDSDFSAFVTQGVDKSVQRLAMKKLFSDPHFSLMDGLDVYIDDFTKSDPIPAAMLASMQHARSMFSRLLEDDDNKPGEPGHQPKEPPDPDTPLQGDA
jgi:hypothetical protein